MTHTKEILVIAGEASGDVLGAELIYLLQKNDPSLKIEAMGGAKIQATGAEILVDSRHLSVIGLWEVITHFFIIRRAYNTLKQYLKEHKPALLITIDYPGFNLRMAKIAHEQNIKVLHYVSPQIWASRYHRIHSIKKYIHHIVVFFKFEQAIYEREGVPVSLVAHPLLKLSQIDVDCSAIAQKLNLNLEAPIIALLPGSRPGEIKKLMPIILAAKNLIKAQIPSAQFVLPLASSLKPSNLEIYLDDSIILTELPAYEILKLSTAAIVTSGTATLEAALMKTPLVVIYKVFGYQIAKKWIIKTPYIGLCNIAAGECVAKEFIQHDAKPELIAAEIVKLIEDAVYRKETLLKLERVRNQLGHKDAAVCLVELIKQTL